MPITTHLRRYDAVTVDAQAEGLTEAQQQEIDSVRAELESRLSTMATAGNAEAQRSCNANNIRFTPNSN